MEFILPCGYLVEFWKAIRILGGIWIWIVRVMPFHPPWMQCWHCFLASMWSFSCPVYLGKDASIMLPTMMFPHIVESDCYIDINVSEIHSGNCGKSTAHAQNIILIFIGLGFFEMFRFARGHLPFLSSLLVNQSERNFAQR